MVKEILKGLAWGIVAVLLALFLQRPIEEWFAKRTQARMIPHQVLAQAESERAQWTQSSLNSASQRCKSLLDGSPEIRAQAFQTLSRTYSDWAALRYRLGLSMGSYPDRALAYAFEAERVAPQAVESEIALAYAFDSLEAGVDKRATRVKVQNLVGSEKGGPDLDYLSWVTKSNQQTDSYPERIDPETLTSVRMLVDLGTYFVIQAEKKSTPDRERLLKRGTTFCDRASQLAPENPVASFCQGYASATAGNMSEAHDHYAKALQSEAEFPRARNNLGYTYAVEGDYNNAKNLFEAAVVTLDAPLNSKALWLHNLGSDYLELNQIEKACDAWSRAAQLPGSNDSFRTFWGLSMCSYERNDKKQSLENYRKAVELAHKQNVDLAKVSTFQEGKAGPNELRIATDLMKIRH